jgi:hypothetical protein
MELDVRVNNSGYNVLRNGFAFLMIILTSLFILFNPSTMAFASSNDENH